MAAVRRLAVVLLPAVATLLVAGPAGAQEDGPVAVDISFEIGRYDPALGDFAVTTVVVERSGTGPDEITVELRDDSGGLLWTRSAPMDGSTARIAVSPPVAVGRVASAGVVQSAPVVAEERFVPPDLFHSAQGGGGSGQLALSLVLVVALVAIVFRTPLPSASSQRWTR